MLCDILTSKNQIVLVSISNIRKKIGVSILLNIKLDLFWRALLNFYKYFVHFEGFLVSRLGVTNKLFNMLAIVIALLQFLFWIRIILHCDGSNVSCLLPKYIKMSWLYVTWFSYSCRTAFWYSKSWHKVEKNSKNSCSLVETKWVKFIFTWKILFAICYAFLLLFLLYNNFKNSNIMNVSMKLRLFWLINKFTPWKS